MTALGRANVCVDRDHPTLCSYEPVELAKKKRKLAPSDSAASDSVLEATVAAPTSRTLTPVSVARDENLVQGLTSTEQTSTEQFVGDSSIPGFVLGGVSPADAERLGTNRGELRSLLLPALGLQRSACGSMAVSMQQASVVLRVVEVLPRSSEVVR